MKTSIRKSYLLPLVLTLVTLGATAQDTSTTSIRHGDPSHESNVKNAKVVYVEGNDLVLKLENGKVEHLVVPADEKFIIGGREVTVDELKPGTSLTQTIVTTTTPRYVNTVRTIKGKVWHVSAPGSLIVSLPDGTNQFFSVPSHATFTVNGEQKTVFELRKGMKFQATIVADEQETVVHRSKATTGEEAHPYLPELAGVLLFQGYAPQIEQETASVTAEHVDPPASALPDTASVLPLTGLLGALGIASSLGLGRIRKYLAK